jgi:hypothetical protein
MGKVCERRNLLAALKRVRNNAGKPGSDGMTVKELPAYLRVHWPRLREELLAGRYQPQPVRRVAIPKPGGGERELGCAPVFPCADRKCTLSDPTGCAASRSLTSRQSRIAMETSSARQLLPGCNGAQTR